MSGLAAVCLISFAVLAQHWPAFAAPDRKTADLADSMQRKIDLINANAKNPEPEDATTVFQQDEINAYFAERRLKMPDGVRSVIFDLDPQKVSAHARIDFDEITRAHRSSNPLLQLFTGVHDVDVVADAGNPRQGTVRVTVRSVAIDGVTVPNLILDLFVKRFVNPKYPSVGLDRDYTLPAHISSVAIAEHKGTVNQE